MYFDHTESDSFYNHQAASLLCQFISSFLCILNCKMSAKRLKLSLLPNWLKEVMFLVALVCLPSQDSDITASFKVCICDEWTREDNLCTTYNSELISCRIWNLEIM